MAALPGTTTLHHSFLTPPQHELAIVPTSREREKQMLSSIYIRDVEG